jgi:glycosyltransferase involved in cell wall biosynthesis
MLSILIPVYNFPCFELVRDLVAQAAAVGVPCEIICMDDASSRYKDENRVVLDFPQVTYIELTENIGRSRIRNRLVSKAQYEMLLFLDCDSRIVQRDFIEKYVEAFRRADILAGGTLYDPCPPTDKDYLLHWTVGSRREPKPDGNQRKTFASNNYVIRRAIIEQCPFNEKVVRYGHEDSLFQMELERLGKAICFVQNPVVHIGLETNRRFIEKTRESVVNLYNLYALGIFDGLDIGKIRLLKTYLLFKKWKADGWLNRLFPFVNRLNEKTNAIGKPNLWVFDWYKLTLLSRYANAQSLGLLKNEEKYTEI